MMVFSRFAILSFKYYHWLCKLPIVIHADSLWEMKGLVGHVRESLQVNYDDVDCELLLPIIDDTDEIISSHLEYLKNQYSISAQMIARFWDVNGINVTKFKTLNEHLDMAISVAQKYGDKRIASVNHIDCWTVFVTDIRAEQSAKVELLDIDLVLLDASEPIYFVTDYSDEPLLEYVPYQKVPGSSFSVRFDTANTSTKVQKHAHVFSSKGKELMSVNLDGTGHDGSTGSTLPKEVADYLRGKGFSIPQNNILEYVSIDPLQEYRVYKIGGGYISQEEITMS